MLRKEFRSSANNARVFTGTPPWINNLSDAWELSSSTDIDYGISEVDNTIYIQYGQRTSLWATNRFWSYSVEISNETLNEDNSISASTKITPKFWKTELVNPGAGVSVEYDISIGGKTVWSYSGTTQDVIDKSSIESYTLNLNVKPKQYSTDTAIKISVRYPNGEYDDSYIYVGLYLYNDREVDTSFKPWALRKSNVFKTLNNSKGHFYIRKGSWSEISKNKTKGKEQGNNRIRKSNRWLGQSKAGS